MTRLDRKQVTITILTTYIWSFIHNSVYLDGSQNNVSYVVVWLKLTHFYNFLLFHPELEKATINYALPRETVHPTVDTVHVVGDAETSSN